MDATLRRRLLACLVLAFFAQTWLVYTDTEGRAAPALSTEAARGREIRRAETQSLHARACTYKVSGFHIQHQVRRLCHRNARRGTYHYRGDYRALIADPAGDNYQNSDSYQRHPAKR